MLTKAKVTLCTISALVKLHVCSQEMEDLFGCAGVGSVLEGTVVSSALYPVQPTRHTTLKTPAPAAQMEAAQMPAPAAQMPAPAAQMEAAQMPAPAAQMPAPAAQMEAAQMPAPAAQMPAPAPPPSAVSASSTRQRPATQESLLNTSTAHAERRTAALELLVSPDLERWRRLKERRRRRFENKVLSKLAEMPETKCHNNKASICMWSGHLFCNIMHEHRVPTVIFSMTFPD